MSFTPGPWEIKLYPYPSRRRKKPCIGISSRHARDFIAQYIRSDADARLIAAAPEMLELLRKAWLEMDNALLTYIPVGKDGEDMAELCGKIETLIDRIDGEEGNE